MYGVGTTTARSISLIVFLQSICRDHFEPRESVKDFHDLSFWNMASIRARRTVEKFRLSKYRYLCCCVRWYREHLTRCSFARGNAKYSGVSTRP